MQLIQEMLLDMLKEIDDICRENDIKYFIDGGTTLGAVRHEGFIPWDNDADIVMTEDNYNKFAEVVNKNTDKTHRAVQDNRLNREYGTTFGRYINMDTTKITKNTPFWDEKNAYAGLIIDIFILFPLPKKEPARTEYMNLMALYDEFQNNTFRHTGKRTDAFVRAYKEASKKSKKIGQVAVLEEMEAQLFNQHLADDEYDEYLYVSSPRMYLRTFPRWMFDEEPARIPFEGAMLPVSKYYHEEMRHFYGEDYFMIPNEGGQKVHVDLHSKDIPYPYFVKDYMRFLDPADVKNKRKIYKDAFVEEGFKRKIWDEDMIRFVSDRVIKNTIRRAEGVDLAAELATENWELLNSIFDEYYKYQFNAAYGYWYQFINIPDDMLYIALMNLINQKGDYGKISRLMVRYQEHVSKEYPKSMADIQKLFDAIFAVRCPRFYGRTKDGVEALAAAEKKYPSNREIKIERLLYDMELADGKSSDDLIKDADALLAKYPGNEDVIKARADIMWNKGDHATAMKVYDELYDKTRNGFIKLDIEKKRKA